MDPLDRMLATMHSAFGAMAQRGGRRLEWDGITAMVMPTVPERSLVNCVIYSRDADLRPVYDELEAAYTGVDAWTVWVPEGDTTTTEFLAERGHALDAAPAAMAVELASFEPPASLPVWEHATPADLGRINDAAYPMRDGTLDRAMREAGSAEDFHLYIAEDACVVGIHDCAGDAGVFFVATLPAARGRGLGGGLLAVALLEARERGCDISTLQATKAGEPVYARLGYERFGTIGMWEKRSA